ncbi:MAG: sporulation transcription factor Spo0A [Defluviitaleaceae bacterium]|nr:sporulation transcription factor Spo0A [Defluviitaleaceae bacterium]
METISVFLADDNKDFCDVISESFNKYNDIKMVGVAHDGIEAYSKIIELKPDVALIDGVMPHLDGMGVLEKLKQQDGPIPIFIMLSAMTGEKIIKRAMELGVEYYVVKPFDIDVMVSRIRQLKQSKKDEPMGGAFINSPKIPNLETKVTNILQNLGVPASIRGYNYMREAILMGIDNPDILNYITKELYPSVAKKFHTSHSRVERAIRHAIEVAWSRGDIDVIIQYFKGTVNINKGKPTNSEFISLIADRLRLEIKDNMMV